MTQGGNETDPTKRRSIRWKGRFSRTARQSQQGEEGLEQKQLLPPSDTTSKLTNSDISSCMENSDNISIHSGSSCDTPGEAYLNGPIMTKAQLTRNKDFHENFKQVPLGDTLLHGKESLLQLYWYLYKRLFDD